MNTVGIVTFTLAGETYGIAAMSVREIAKAIVVRPLPDAPAVVEGAIEYQGQTMPVLDLRARFGLGARKSAPPSHFIIAECERGLVALDVDSVVSMMEVPVDWVEVSDGQPVGAAGIIDTPDGLRVISDVNQVLEGCDPEILESMLTAH